MPQGRTTTLAILAALTLSACSKNTAPSETTAPAPAPPSAAQTQPPEGTPQLATEPDGVHIEYRVAGKGEPAIVLIHGWATDANYWNAQIAPLQAKYTVVALDLAGHG